MLGRCFPTCAMASRIVLQKRNSQHAAFLTKCAHLFRVASAVFLFKSNGVNFTQRRFYGLYIHRYIHGYSGTYVGLCICLYIPARNNARDLILQHISRETSYMLNGNRRVNRKCMCVCVASLMIRLIASTYCFTFMKIDECSPQEITWLSLI